MEQENTQPNYIVHENELIIRDCSGANMLSLIVCFNFFLFTNLGFADSDIQDSDARKFVGISNVVNLRLNNCSNITDQGLIELVQVIKPENLIVSDCSNITDECLKECNYIINASAPDSHVSTTQYTHINGEHCKQ